MHLINSRWVIDFEGMDMADWIVWMTRFWHDRLDVLEELLKRMD